MDFCNDTLSALNCIKMLGAEAERTDEHTIVVEGGLKPRGNLLSVGESGLSARLFTPIAALCGEPIVISGEGTLLYRPMDMMIQPLRALGVDVRDGGGRLPIEVCGPMKGGQIDVDGSVSSQFITGLLLSLPLAEQDTVINVNAAVSKPYLDMTIDTAESRPAVRCGHPVRNVSSPRQPRQVSSESPWISASTDASRGISYHRRISLFTGTAAAFRPRAASCSTAARQPFSRQV